MNELSLYILDLMHNCVNAKAKNIKLMIVEDERSDVLKIIIEDDGEGMSKEALNNVVSPFYTSRVTREVGLGIPLFKELCETCLGKLEITSSSCGTTLIGTMQLSAIDLLPLGSIEETIYLMMLEDVDIEYIHTLDSDNTFTINSKIIKNILNDVDLRTLEISKWIKDYIREGLNTLRRS